jgi:methylated-DNA-[protein]-cysteine S-methyltransferase
MLERVRCELESYFDGRTRRFRTPLDFGDVGTPFQRRVWEELLEIPYGEIVSYGDVARAVGSPRGVRAVGQAVGRNPIPVIVPCHRVVGSDRRLTGFGCGLPVKVRLLELEGVPLGPPTGADARRKVLPAF